MHDNYLNEDKKKQIDNFNKKLKDLLNDDNFQLDGNGEFDSMYLEDIKDDLLFNPSVVSPGIEPTAEDYGDMIVEEQPDQDDLDDDAINKYLNAKILGVGMNNERWGHVIKQLKGLDGKPIGCTHSNPLFDTREYEIKFTDRMIEKYQANIIAENMYAQVNEEGRKYLVLEEIIDHKKDNTAVPISHGMIQSANSEMKPKKTMQGWHFLMLTKDKSLEWMTLKELKASHPIELAKYAVANHLTEEPAFKWWVPHVLCQWKQIISKVKGQHWQMTHKFGIILPHSVEEALMIDEQTGTNFWWQAINKEMQHMKIAWIAKDGFTPEQVWKGQVPELRSFQEIGCHCIFDIKMDFTCKCRFVAGGHTTEAPASVTYLSIVSCDSV